MESNLNTSGVQTTLPNSSAESGTINVLMDPVLQAKIERRKKILVTATISVVMLCMLLYLLYTNGKYINMAMPRN